MSALFIAMSLPAAAGDAAGSDTDAGADPTPEWAQDLYEGPPEFKIFEVAGYRFKVPHEYLTASSDQDRGVFQIAPHWPTLDSPRTEKPQPRDRADFDTLQVTVRAWSESDYRGRVERRRRRLHELRSASKDSGLTIERTHGLLRGEGQSFFYSPMPLKLGVVEQPVEIICGSVDCWINYMPITHVGVEIRFDRAILPKWRTLVHRVTELLNKYRKD